MLWQPDNAPGRAEGFRLDEKGQSTPVVMAAAAAELKRRNTFKWIRLLGRPLYVRIA